MFPCTRNRNEGTFRCQKPERGYSRMFQAPKTRTFYKAALLFALEFLLYCMLISVGVISDVMMTKFTHVWNFICIFSCPSLNLLACCRHSRAPLSSKSPPIGAWRAIFFFNRLQARLSRERSFSLACTDLLASDSLATFQPQASKSTSFAFPRFSHVLCLECGEHFRLFPLIFCCSSIPHS